MSLKELLENNFVHFVFYRKGFLYYKITEPTMEITEPRRTYIFPVPIEDTGDASFNAKEKAIFMMRYIRKAQSEGSFVLYHG